MRPFLYLFLLLTLTNCSKRVLVRFKQPDAEIKSSESLAQVMLVNKAPKIVLRVPETHKGITTDQAADKKRARDPRKSTTQKQESFYDNNLLYNAIEKELFNQNFSVRDRALFNEVIDKASSVDYSKLNGLTNTDLILELINMNHEVVYRTNQCFQVGKNGKEKLILLPNEFSRLGASVEYRLVYVKTNEVVGSYKFQYTPCVSGCEYEYKGGRLYPIVKRTKIGPYEAVEPDVLEQFITHATKQLVDAMR
ncbi:hypothetical protein GCM10028807_60480 [Spirosoma daeguense]